MRSLQSARKRNEAWQLDNNIVRPLVTGGIPYKASPIPNGPVISGIPIGGKGQLPRSYINLKCLKCIMSYAYIVVEIRNFSQKSNTE